MFDTVTIAYRGTKYEIGRGRDYFGIWAVGTSRSQPLEWWPETPEGWSAAWTRYLDMETPGTINPVGRKAGASGERMAAGGQGLSQVIGSRRGPVMAALLLAAGVALGVAGLFPAYLGGSSLAQQPDNLVAHVIYLAAWSASAVLIPLGGTRQRIGALLAAGLSIVTFGLFFADAGTAFSTGSPGGAGLVLSLLGWFGCAAGSALAFWPRAAGTAGQPRPLGKPHGSQVGPAVLLVLAGLGAAAAFAPAWDSFTLRTAAGLTQTVTAGNAFASPGLVIVGDVAVMVALAAVVIAAALWRPIRHGAVLLAGAIIPMAAQAISALVQVGEPASPAQFGFSSSQASQLGLTISSALTPAFWIYSAFVIALMVSCAWMLFTPHQAAQPARFGADPGYDPGFGFAAGASTDTEVEQWHIARSGAFDPGARDSEDAGDLDDADDLHDADDLDDLEDVEDEDRDGAGPAQGLA
ncbi:MAG TPA: hypothetical protein VGY96_24370 [Streptosporangiaceae bacterium]|nr:hypothetical protein [Streptosporangiaceae bacterium]